MKKAAIMLAAMAVLCACTVKENRVFCPAWCVVYSDGHVADGCVGELTCNVATEADRNFVFGRREYTSFEHKGDLVLEVPRNERVFLDLFCGVDKMALVGSVLAIPRGCSCDNIYSGHGSVYISGEAGEAGLPLNKDYAQISLQVRGDIHEEYPFVFRVLGNVDGYELPGGQPHKGEFDCMPEREEGDIFRVKVPRQTDDSLMLELLHKNDGSLVTRLELGKMVKEMGFDWSAPDLRDIGIGVEVAEAAFTVEIEAWDVTDTVTIII